MTARAAGRLAVVAVAAACAGWRSAAPPYPARLDPTRLVEVWRADTATVLRNVTIDSLAVAGVPIFACDGCRVAIPLANVDSMRVAATTPGLTAVAVIGVAVFVVWLLHDWPCWPDQPCNP